MSKPAPVLDAAATASSGGKKSLVGKLKIAGIVLGVVVAEWVVAYMYLPSAQATNAASSASEHGDDVDAEEHEGATDDADSADHGSHGDKPADDGHHEKAGHEKGGHDKAGHDKGGHDKGGHDKAAHGHDKPAHGKAEHGKADEKPARTTSYSGQEEVDLGEFTVTGYQPVSNATLFISFRLYGTIRHRDSHEFSSRLEDSKHRIRDNVIVIIRSAEIADLTDAGLGLIKRRILETTNKTLGKPLLQGVIFSEFSFIEQ